MVSKRNSLYNKSFVRKDYEQLLLSLQLDELLPPRIENNLRTSKSMLNVIPSDVLSQELPSFDQPTSGDVNTG